MLVFVKDYLEVNEDILQILLMLEIPFTHDSKVKDLVCGALFGSEPSLDFGNYLYGFRFKPFQTIFSMTLLK